MTTINFLPLGALRLHFKGAHLVPGLGAHQLRLEFEASADWLPDDEVPSAVPILLAGSVWTFSPLPFKPLAGSIAVSATVRRFDTALILTTMITDDELVALEQAVDVHDLVLNLKLVVTLLRSDPEIDPVMDTEMTLRVDHARWLQLLDSAGAGAAITVRVPSPLTPAADSLPESDPSLSRAARRLREARNSLRDGRPELCVIACRHVLEEIERLADLPSQRSIDQVGVKARDKLQRWAALYWAAKSLANAAHHDSAGISFDRMDAEAVLAMTAALLLRFTQSPESLTKTRNET